MIRLVMAECRKIQQPIINVSIHITQEGDRITTTNIEQNTTNINESEIGQILIPESSESHSGPGDQPARPRAPQGSHTEADDLAVNTSREEAEIPGMPNFAASKMTHANVSTPQYERMDSASQYTDYHIAEEKADALMAETRFGEAVALLEDLPPTQRQQMQLMECYFQLERDSQVSRCIAMIENLIIREPRPKAEDLYNLGMANYEASHHMKALTFFLCASKLYKLNSNPNDAVYWIRACSYRSYNVIKSMARHSNRMHVIARDIGVESVLQMLSDIRSVSGVDPDKKVECEAYCLNNIGSTYRNINKPLKAIEFHKQGVYILQRHFGQNASKFKVLGILLKSLGAAYVNSEDYAEAKKLYAEAFTIFESALDYANDKERKNYIQVTKDILDKITKK